MMIFTQILYFDVPFWTFTWMNDYVSEFMLNVAYVWGRDWFLLTNSFRTLLTFYDAVACYVLNSLLGENKKQYVFLFCCHDSFFSDS